MLRSFISVLSALLGQVLLAPTAQAQAQTSVFNEKVPVSGVLENPCPPEELVAFEGSSHVLIRTTFDHSGGGHFTFHINPQGISGVGLSSGDRYSLVEPVNQTSNFRSGAETTFTYRFKMVRQGSADNFYFSQTAHTTVLANGEITVIFGNERIECQG